MTKRFRPWDPKQKWLLPPEITEFIADGHPAHFVRNLKQAMGFRQFLLSSDFRGPSTATDS